MSLLAQLHAERVARQEAARAAAARSAPIEPAPQNAPPERAQPAPPAPEPAMSQSDTPPQRAPPPPPPTEPAPPAAAETSVTAPPIDLTADDAPAPAPAPEGAVIDMTLSDDDAAAAPAPKRARAAAPTFDPLPAAALDFGTYELVQTRPRPVIVFRNVGGDGLERLCDRLVRDAARAFPCAGGACRGAYRRGDRFRCAATDDDLYCSACAAALPAAYGAVSGVPETNPWTKKGPLGSSGFASMCGAAEKLPGSKDNYQIIADPNSMKRNAKKTILSHDDANRWFAAVAGPALRAFEAVARRAGAPVAAETLGRCGRAPIPEGDVRVLRYPATGRAEASFHRHRDHPHHGMVVLASLRASCDFFVRQTADAPAADGPGDVVRLDHGDVIVFDATRERDGSGFAHGVEVVHKPARGPKWAERVSIQWRMNPPGRTRRLKLAWALLNLAEFEERVFADVLPDASAAPRDRVRESEAFARRALADPRLLDAAFARVLAVTLANPKKYLARRLGTCFGGTREHFASAWHNCRDVTDAVWRTALDVHVVGGGKATLRLPPPGENDDG